MRMSRAPLGTSRFAVRFRRRSHWKLGELGVVDMLGEYGVPGKVGISSEVLDPGDFTRAHWRLNACCIAASCSGKRDLPRLRPPNLLHSA